MQYKSYKFSSMAANKNAAIFGLFAEEGDQKEA